MTRLVHFFSKSASASPVDIYVGGERHAALEAALLRFDGVRVALYDSPAPEATVGIFVLAADPSSWPNTDLDAFFALRERSAAVTIMPLFREPATGDNDARVQRVRALVSETLEPVDVAARVAVRWARATAGPLPARAAILRAQLARARKASPAMVDVLARMALLHLASDEDDQALAHVRSALTMVNTASFANNGTPVERGRALYELGSVILELGDAQTARDVLRGSVAAFDQPTMSQSEAYAELARACRQLSDKRGVIEAMTRAVEMRSGTLGEGDTAELAIDLLNLANAHGDVREFHEQKRLLERALAAQERAFGIDGRSPIAITLTSLATVEGNLGNAPRQRALLERAVALFEKFIATGAPMNNVYMAVALINLAEASSDAPQLAIRHLERALALIDSSGGDAQERQACFAAFELLAELHVGTDALADVLNRQLAATEEMCTNNDDLINALLALSKAALRMRLPERQRALLERALALQPTVEAKSNVLVNLAIAYCELGDAAEMKRLLLEALALHDVAGKGETMEVAVVLVNLANAHGLLGDDVTRRDMLKRALAILEPACGPTSPEVASALVNLGWVTVTLGDVAAGLAHLHRALAIKEGAFGVDSAELCNVLKTMSDTYGREGNATQQRTHLTRALDIARRRLGAQHPSTLMYAALVSGLA
jgi:tetratricopeptide (TPR) repeat protein